MKLSLRPLFAAFALGFATLSTAQADVSILLAGGFLKDQNSTRIQYGSGTLLLVASTADSFFTTPSAAFNLSVGSPVQSGSDDVVLFKSSISGDGNQNRAPDAGEFRQLAAGITLGAAARGTVAAGDALILYWFPSVDSSSTSLTAGTRYGAYRSNMLSGSDNDGSQAWYIPADGTSGYSLVFATSDAGSAVNFSTSGDSYGQAAETVIPEPSTWLGGLLLGTLAGFAVCRSLPRNAGSAGVKRSG